MKIKPVMQTLFGGDPDNPVELGNCWPACFATLLGLELNDVPHFYAEERDPQKANYNAWTWLRERGWHVIAITWTEHAPFQLPGEIVIISGKSPRGAHEHAVIGRIDHTKEFGFELLHDPHPSGAGIEGVPISYEILFRKQTFKEL